MRNKFSFQLSIDKVFLNVHVDEQQVFVDKCICQFLLLVWDDKQVFF